MTRTITAVYKSHNIFLSLYAEGGITVCAQHVSRAWDDIKFDIDESEPFDSDESAFSYVADIITSVSETESEPEFYEWEFSRLDWTEI